MSSSALAADLLEPVVPVEPVVIEEAAFTWTGFYAGLNAGWYWEAGNDDDNGRRGRRVCRRDPRVDVVDQDGQVDVIVDENRRCFGRRGRHGNDNDANGPFVGAQIGANYQTGIFVFGVEGDLQYSDFDDDDNDRRGRHRGRRDRDVVRASFGFDHDRGTDVDWFGTARLRAGVAVGPEGRTLLYGTGGFAWGGVDHNQNFRINARVRDRDVNVRVRGRRHGNGDNDETEYGFALGAGVEHAFTDNITVGAEYQYISLGNDEDNGRRHRTGAFGRHFNNNDDFDFHTVRLKVNFLFGPGGLFGGQ